jgi:hypothetical protein
MNTQGLDLRFTDVIRMARETGIDIFHLYNVFQLPPDPATQEYLLRQKEAHATGDKKLIEQMSHEMDKYAIDMGSSTDMSVYERFGTTQVETAKLELDMLGEEPSPERMRALLLARERARTGIPWATNNQCIAISEQAEEIKSLEEMWNLFREIPSGAQREREIVLRIMAYRFFQY